MMLIFLGRSVESYFIGHTSVRMVLPMTMFNALVLRTPDVINIIDGQMNQVKGGQVPKQTQCQESKNHSKSMFL